VEFQRTDQVPELYTAGDAGTAPAGRLLLLLPQGTASPPQTIPFADSWTGSGTYLFVAAAIADAALPAFANAAWQFLGDRRLQGTRFAWFEPPDDSGVLQGTTIQVADLGAGPVVAFGASFGFRNVALELPAGTPVAVDDDAGFGFKFGSAEQRSPILVTARSGAVAAGTVTPPVKLSMADALQGCLRFELALEQDDLDSLDVGFRYFYGRPPDPKKPKRPASEFFMASQRYPLFDQGLTAYPSLDPLAPLDQTRTFFALSAADAQLPAATATPLSSFFRTTLDDAFALTPLTGSAAPTHFAALVFTERQGASDSSDRDPFYLAPVGDFGLTTTRTGKADVMGGLSGVEYFELPAATGTVSFYTGGPAFAAGFLPGKPAGVTELAPKTVPTTSYAWIGLESGVDYYAQPDQSVLYNYPAQQAAGVTTITPLTAVPVHAATLPWPPPAGPTPANAFPLLPYAGLHGARLKAFRQLEAQVVSPARRHRLTQAPAVARPMLAALASGTPQSSYSTTPQGLLASYTPGGSTTQWDSIVLAQMKVAKLTMQLTAVDGDLLSAFQSNKMFLVLSDPDSVRKYLQAADAEIRIGADPTELWQFDLDPAQWDAYKTVLIVKFYDMSIEQLAGQTGVWSFGGVFNKNPAATSKQILETIAKAKAKAPGDSDYQAFVDAVTDRNWNGILALSVRSPIDDLPSELQGLAVGIDPSLFKAHHVGINASKINVPGAGQKIGIDDSSIFALIDYQAPRPLPPQAGDWAFQVETLKVLFANSVVTAFSSIIELEVNTLFGEPATLEGGTVSKPNDNIVYLYGVYQKHIVNGSVVESYTFTTQDGQDAVFDMGTSQVLNSVRISKAQFVTVIGKTTSSYVESQFLLWGLIDFKALKGSGAGSDFDVFSFGRTKAGDRAGLAFSNLIIDMSFDPQVQPEVPVWAFDANSLSLDMTGSTARADSLFQHFPVTVARVTQGSAGASPTDLGYMGVQTPLSQSALAYPWFSLDYDLNLGTPGALAAEAGFVATLTAAWSPGGGSGYQVFVGLKLPGSSGAKRAISIESLFDITFKTIEIVVPAADTFILVLYGIGFKFLSFTFPPSGQVNFALFGDPTSSGKGDTSLGWYAAYAKSESQGQASGGGDQKQLAAAPAQLPAGTGGGPA
jgi:hypothetical protein